MTTWYYDGKFDKKNTFVKILFRKMWSIGKRPEVYKKVYWLR